MYFVNYCETGLTFPSWPMFCQNVLLPIDLKAGIQKASDRTNHPFINNWLINDVLVLTWRENILSCFTWMHNKCNHFIYLPLDSRYSVDIIDSPLPSTSFTLCQPIDLLPTQPTDHTLHLGLALPQLSLAATTTPPPTLCTPPSVRPRL